MAFNHKQTINIKTKDVSDLAEKVLADMFMTDGLHLSGKGAAVFADELLGAVDSGMGNIKHIFGSKHCLN